MLGVIILCNQWPHIELPNQAVVDILRAELVACVHDGGIAGHRSTVQADASVQGVFHSSIAHDVMDRLQDWINIFQVPVKGFTFQFLPECSSGRDVSIINPRALKKTMEKQCAFLCFVPGSSLDSTAGAGSSE